MKSVQTTKKALLSAVVAVLVSFSMLVGTTFAWFTDSVTSNNNVIQSGNLDVELYMHNGTEYVDISSSAKPIFGEGSLIEEWEDVNTLWEPGKTQIVYLAVKNAGSLSLKYNILADVTDNGLASALEYAVIDGVTKADADALNLSKWSDIIQSGSAQSGKITAGRIIAAENGALLKGEYDYFALAIHMQEEAGNEYKNKGIVVDVTIMATQYTYENDSFGDDYDEDAELDVTDGMAVKLGNSYFPDFASAISAAQDGDTIDMVESYNTQNDQITETIEITKDITLNPNGMYLVSNAPATFEVKDGGKLTVTDGSFTIKNTASNGAAVVVDGGEFVMAGGSFDAHTAVRTVEGKSSTVTIEAGWSNRVTVGIDSKGNDTINVTGGSLYTNKETIKTTAGTHVNINIDGGLIQSSNTTNLSATVKLNGTATINMTGGTIANTYVSGLNGSAAIDAPIAPTEINVSGNAKITSKGWGLNLGKDSRGTFSPTPEKVKVNVSGNAVIEVVSDMGMGMRYLNDYVDVTIGGNAKVTGSYHGISFSVNRLLFTNSSLTIKDNATISSPGSRIGGGYGIGANGNVTITGGNISGKVAGLAVAITGPVIIVDNRATGTPITISSKQIADGVDYTEYII